MGGCRAPGRGGKRGAGWRYLRGGGNILRMVAALLLLLLPRAAAAGTASPEQQPAVTFLRYGEGGTCPCGIQLGQRDMLPHSSTWAQSTPLQLEIVAADGSSHWLRTGYSLVNDAEDHAEGVVTTPGGARLSVSDSYLSAEGGGFIVNRTVTVLDGGSDDEVGFSSRFSLASETGALGPAPLRELEFFMPGVW